MAIQYFNREFLNHNSVRSYPLVAEATALATTGTFRLPKDFIVGLKLSIHWGVNVDPAHFCIKSMSVQSTGINLVVGYYNGTETVSVASANIPRTGHTRNWPYRLGGLGDFVDCFGEVVIGQFDAIDDQPPGDWTFDPGATRLELDAIAPYVYGVSSLRIQNGADLGERLYGDIILRAGNNMRISTIVAEGQDPVISFDAIEGEGLNEVCVCEGDSSRSPIYTINRIQPTTDGDFSFLGSSCLEVRSQTNGLKLVDVCSEPCCGCKELETITEALEIFGRQATTLENFLVSLEARVTQMDQVVLASKLGDRACNEC
jgi:hypothetical protein